MHQELFHSPERPFRATPDTRFYFPYESMEQARQTTVRAALRAEGPVMILGGAGLGKSLLGMVVAQDLASRFDVVQLHAARLCSRRALLQNILFELRMPYRDLSEGDLRLSILTRLEPSSDYAPEGVLMIVDEAHTLPAKLLDELRLINNFTRGNQPRTRLVLIGNLRLEHTFAEPQMESFNQRLAARCYLQPMNRQQTSDYIRHQLTVAGLDPSQLITEAAMQTVYAACDGVPRLTNQVMDHVLALASAGNQCPVSSALVEEAWSDLQQLPAPWHAGADKGSQAATRQADAGKTVEFGALQDDQLWPAEDNTESDSEMFHDTAASDAPSTAPSTAPSPSFFAAFHAAEDSAEDVLLLADSYDMGPTRETQKMKNTAEVAAEVPAEAAAEVPAVSSPPDHPTRELRATSPTLGNTRDASAASPRAAANCGDAKDPLVRPRVVFDAGEAFAFIKGENPQATLAICAPKIEAERQSEPCASSDPCSADECSEDPESFFSNRPTDEQLLALEDEQQEYDAMGVWENDPPLSPRAMENVSQDPPIFHRSPGASQLFGDDFEIEESLNTSSSGLDSLTVGSARQAADAADYVSRIQHYADALKGEQPAIPVQRPAMVSDKSRAQYSDELIQEFAAERTELANASGLDTWTLDVATLDSATESAVHEEIEDMVSQLNFAAFSVEPFSVEQIPVESPVPRVRPVGDSSRSGPNDEIYTMHRPLEKLALEESRGSQGLFANSADDDRDMLVIEEELPVATKTADQKDQAVTKIAPYSQLFAKLRK